MPEYKVANKLFQYIPVPTEPPSNSLDAAPPQTAAEQERYAYLAKEYDHD